MRTSRRSHLTIGRLMIVIGVAALVFALTRVDAAPGVSLCIFAGCAWYLASRRFAEAMAQRAVEGLTTSQAQKARILIKAASIAVVAIGLPDAAFLASYYGYMEAIRAMGVRPFYRTPYDDPWSILVGAFFGIIAALYVASIVRRWIGPIVGKQPASAATPAREPVRSLPEPERVATKTNRRRHLTLGHLMIVIGVAALIFALTHVDAAPGVSLCIFAGCTWYLTSRRFAEAMAQRAAEGLTTSQAQKARILIKAASIAVVAIGLPDAAFLAGYYGYMEAIRATSVRPPYWFPYDDPQSILAGAFFGIIAALYVAFIVRRWIGPIAGKKPASATTPTREPVRSRPEPERVATGG
jgi:hypothetical protein